MDLTNLQEIIEMAGVIEAFIPMLNKVVERYQPIVKDIAGEFATLYDSATGNQKVYEVTARNKRMQYEAYLNSGFTSEQAMLFLLNAHGISSAANITNLLTRSISASPQTK